MQTKRQDSNWLCVVTCLLVTILLTPKAYAVPSFARQTGQPCSTCHTSWLELKPFGRHFKLTGYTIGEYALPLAVMAQIGATTTKNPNDSAGDPLVDYDGDLRFSGASIFLAGKATDNIGGFIQWTYDNGNPHHSSVDNVDIRAAWDLSFADKELILGVNLNNNPTLQDVWNSTPAFGYPYTSSPYMIGSPVSTIVDGGLGQLAAGTGAYAYWNRNLYGEISFYRTADGIFSPLRAGIPSADRVTLDGENPYWRFAYNRDWGANSLMVGTYGMHVDMYSDPNDKNSPVNTFTDTALDAQYQYITDPHILTVQGTWIHEKQHWNDGSASNTTNMLNTLRGKVTYYYKQKYGGTLSAFSTNGSEDAAMYGDMGSLTGSPNTRGYICELDYLPRENVRLMLQYTGYTKYLGGRSDYDGTGRNASDNNSLFLNLWFLF
jgi:hypothetical protein